MIGCILGEGGGSFSMKGVYSVFHIIIEPPLAFLLVKGRSLSNRSSELKADEYCPERKVVMEGMSH